MTQATTRRRGGAHRKPGKAIKSRIAMVALTSSAVSVSGAAAATAADDAKHANKDLVAQDADKDLAAQDATQAQMSSTPTVLSVRDFRPASDLGSYLATALEYNNLRTAADRAARAPQLSVPTVGTFTSGFGQRWGTTHKGLDIANVTNTPIMSVMDGTVIDSGPAQGFGQWIRVQHDDGSIAVFGHLETLGVAVGQRVTAGQVIGGMGNRGNSTGTHLHFEIYPDTVNAADPVAWFLERGFDVLSQLIT